MADGRAAHDPDRLPWLTEARSPDTRLSRRTSDSSPLLFWAFLAILLIAGLSYWLGTKSVGQPGEITDILGPTAPVAGEPGQVLTNEAVVPLPQPGPVPAPGLSDVAPVARPGLVPIPGVDRARPPKPVTTPESTPETTPEPAPRVSQEAKAPAATRTAPPAAPARTRPSTPPRTRLQAWPADQSANAYGRVVRVGTFYSRRQAKQGWGRIVRVYPGMRRLRAVVVANRSLRTGQTFYRLQFGTTSQAHSAVLCQRMRVVGQSCVTVGLPGGATRR